MANNEIVDRIIKRFNTHGNMAYGEQVNMRQHMLQSAQFAEQAEEDDYIVVACLLHDYGHYVHKLGEAIADEGVDAKHEELGSSALLPFFLTKVVEPIRLHVKAKRYLCATDKDYYSTLTPASVQSLKLQGGFFNKSECNEFEKNPFFTDALKVRRYDEAGKVPKLKTKTINDYVELMTRMLI